MAKKKQAKPVVKEKEPEVLPEVVEEVNTDFVPEVVDEGVVRDEEKENPIDLVNSTVSVRKEGNWKKVTHAELVQLEADGLLAGFDPENSEVLIKEKK